MKNAYKNDHALTQIESVIKKYDPTIPFEYMFVDDQFKDRFKPEVQIGQISSLFTALVVFISCLGLFGLAAFTAARRTKEVSIRKVLGASVASLTGLLSREYLKLVAISWLIAFPIAWYLMDHWLQSYAFKTTISLWIFIATGSIMTGIALLTVSFQVVRTALVNPVENLRRE